MARTFALELALNLQQFRKGMAEVATGLASGVKAGAAGLASSLKPAADGVREIGAAAKEAQVAMLALSGAAAMGLRSMIKNAADDETAARRFAAAYGEAAEGAEKFATELARGSRRGMGEIQALMANFQDFAVAQGVAREDAAKLSQDLTARAVDLAGYYGRDVTEVMGALQQAMMGAGRSARVFGIDVSDTAVKAKALKMGFDPSNMQPWQEAMVRNNLILEQTRDKAGKVGAQAGTYTEELRAMGTALGELWGELGKPVIAVLQPIITAVGDVARSFQEWLAHFPLLRGALGFVTAAALGFVGAASLCATIFAPFISLIKAGYTIMASYAASTKAAALAQSQFTVGTGAATAAVSRLSAAVAAVAVALVGWEIGRALDQLLGLSEGVDAFTRAVKKASDADLAAAWGNPELDDWQREVMANEMMLRRHQKEMLALADARIAKMSEEQKAMAKQLEQWGFTHVQSSILAGDEMKLLKALEARVKAGKGNAEIEALIERLRRRNAAALKAEAEAMDRNKSAAQKLQEAKERLKKGEEEFLKTVEEIGQDVLRAREGEAAAEISTLQKQLEDRRKLLERNATDELAWLRGLESQKAALQAKGITTDKDREELKRLEEEYRKHAANLNTARQAILNAEEAYNLKLRSIYAKRFEDLRAEQQKELQETRENTRAMLDAYEAGINAIDAKLNAIRAKRDQGSESARSFIAELDRNALAARDSTLAEIQSLKERAAAAMLTAETEAQRTAIIQKAAAEAKRMADSTKEIAEAEKAVREARKRSIAASFHDDSPAGWKKALGEQKQKEKELAELREKAVERQKAVAAVAKHMRDMAEMSRKEAAEADAQEEKLKDQRVLLEEEIRDVKRQQDITVQAILDKYREMEMSLTRQLLLEQQIAQARGGARAGEAPAAAPAGKVPSTSEADVAVAEATSAAQAAAAASQAVQAATAQAATAAKTMAQTIQAQLDPLRADLASFIKWAGTFAADLSKLMPQVLQSIGKVLEEQRAFSASLMQFGNVTLQKLGEAQAGFALHRAQLDTLSREIGALKLLEAARGDAGLGAQGY